MRSIRLVKIAKILCLVCITLMLVSLKDHEHDNNYKRYIGRNNAAKQEVPYKQAREFVFTLDKKTFWIEHQVVNDRVKTNGLPSKTDRKLHSLKSKHHHLKPSNIFKSTSNTSSKALNVSLESRTISDGSIYRSLKRETHNGFNIFLYTAIVGNSSRLEKVQWDRIVIQGWEERELHNQTYVCCVLYASGTLQAFKMLRKIHWLPKAQLRAKQFICPNRPKMKGDSPVRVTISASQCHEQYDMYVPTEYAYRHVKQIAVCSKLAYKNLEADDIISWFEVHKLMGVSKVLTFTHKLNHNAMKVLKHYEREGMAEVIPFTLPPSVHGIRHKAMGTKGNQSWNDEQVTVFDCSERLKGYAFVATVDFDEYLLPTKHRTWIGLLKRLVLRNPQAAGFLFLTKLHITSWEPTNNSTRIKIGRYLNRTPVMMDRMKHITLPNRLVPGGLGTHFFKSRHGYDRYPDRTTRNLATIHHFRPCRQEWVWNGSSRCYQLPRYRDESVVKLYKKVESKIMDLKSNLSV